MKNKIKAFFRGALDYIIKAKIELILLFGFLALDLISKAIVANNMHLGETITLLPKFLHLTYIHNDGAAFGSTFGLNKLLGETGIRIFFISFTGLAILFFIYFLYKGKGGHILNRIALSLIIGGAIGNLVDRVIFGFVRDFIEIEYFGFTIFGKKTFAIFNVADIALTVGVILFAVYYIFIYKDKKNEVKTEQIPQKTEENNDENND